MRTIDAVPIEGTVLPMGECPVWDAPTNTLLWLEVPIGRIRRFDVHSQTVDPDSTGVAEPICSFAPRQAGGFVLALHKAFAVLEDDGEFRVLAEVEPDKMGNRLNDGKCDAGGRFWSGSMSWNFHDEPNAGSLYRLDGDGAVTAMTDGVTLSNGLGWSPDGTTMFYIDSLTFGVDAFDFDLATGALSGRRRFADLRPPDDAFVVPDGMTVDAEGGVWVAIFGGGRLCRFLPDGSLDRVVQLPVGYPTSCAFGGSRLDELYITTAGLDDAPHAGGLFVCRPGVSGRAPDVYTGLH